MSFEAVPADVERVATDAIGAAIEVHRHLGPGFLERIYQDALCFEMRLRKIPYQRECSVIVRYKDLTVTGQRIDLIVDSRVVIELKAATRVDLAHEAKVISYLRTTGCRLGLLLNFNCRTMKEGVKRIVALCVLCGRPFVSFVASIDRKETFMKRIVVVLSVALAAPASVAHAELRYTTHVTVRLTPSAATVSAAAEAAATMLKILAPRSMRTYLTDEAARIEPVDGIGPVTLLRRGDVIVLNTATEAYWRLASFERLLADALAGEPLPLRRTGEHATVAGLRAERILFSGSIATPGILVAGVPTTMAVEGELWVTDAFHRYGALASRAIAVSLPFLPSLPEGLVLRQVIRQPALGYEVELSVTEVREEPVPREMFEIPAGYRELVGPIAPARARTP